MDRTLLSNATSSEDAPTPGYMYNEIAKATTANYQANVQIQDFLVSRLSNKSHNVKYKTLVIIKHVCRTGRPEFKKEMSRKVDTIKECLQFRGPPDPLRGDEPYRRVRDAAKEALDAIFDSQMPVTTSAVAAANRIQGMGNDYTPPDSQKQQTGFLNTIVTNIQQKILGDGTDISYNGHPGATGSFSDGGNNKYGGSGSGGYGGSGGGTSSYAGPNGEYPTNSSSGGAGGFSSSSSMTGIGNPNFQDARSERTWVDRAKEMATAGMKSLKTESSTKEYEPEFTSNRGSRAYGQNNEGYKPQSMNAFGANAGVSFQSQNWQTTTPASPMDGTMPPSPYSTGGGGVVPDLPKPPTGMGRAGGAATDGSYEKTLVDSLCEPSGLKTVPPENKLNDFLVGAVSLSPETVGNCIVDALNSDAWQSRVKALIVVASLTEAKDCEPHKEWWLVNIEEVRALATDSKGAVRTQVAKTLRSLTGEEVVIESAGKASSGKIKSTPSTDASRENSQTPPPHSLSQQQPQVQVSLLDMLDEPMVAPIAPAAVNVYSAPSIAAPSMSPVPSGDMFAGMALGAPAPTVAVAVASPAMTNVMSAFDGMQLHSTPTVAPAAIPTSATTSVSSGFDFLGSNTTSVSSPSAQTSINLFDDLTIVSPTPIVAVAPPSQITAHSFQDDFSGLSGGYSAASSFSFLGNAAGPSSAPPTGLSSNINYVQPTTNTISSAFAQPAKPNNDLAFKQLDMIGSSGKNGQRSMPPPQSYGQGYGQPQQQPQAPYGGGRYPAPAAAAPNGYGGAPYPTQPAAYPSNNMYYNTGAGYAANPAAAPAMTMGTVNFNANPQSSVIAPGMLNPMAPRKAIPTADNTGGSSGFNFLGGAGGGPPNRNQSDSFNFVSDAMKNMQK